jgi:hypothetical protein
MVTTVSDIGAIIVNANTFTPRRWKGNPMSADSLLHSVRELFALLQTRGTAYVLVGRIALLHYVEGRNTEDIDLIMALPGLQQLPEIKVQAQDMYFARGMFGELQIDIRLTENRLFDLVRRSYSKVEQFLDQAVTIATVEGLLLLKLYALPSLYRQGNFVRVSLYENDIAALMYAYQPDMPRLFDVLRAYMSTSDLESAQTIAAEIERKSSAFELGAKLEFCGSARRSRCNPRQHLGVRPAAGKQTLEPPGCASIGVVARQGVVARICCTGDGHGKRSIARAMMVDSGDALAHLLRRQRDVLLLVDRADHPAVPLCGAAIGRLAVAADPDRDAWTLHRAGHKLYVVKSEMLAVESDRLARLQMGKNLQALIEDGGATLGAGYGIDRCEVEVDASASAQDHASQAKDVERDQGARQHVRAIAWQRRHIRAEFDPLRCGGHGGQHHPRVARAVGKEHVIPERDRLPASSFGRPRQLNDPARVTVGAEGHDFDAVVHGKPPVVFIVATPPTPSTTHPAHPDRTDYPPSSPSHPTDRTAAAGTPPA